MMRIPRKIYRAELPYMGGKRGIAYELMLCMAQRHPHARYFFDMFGGGGSMSMMAYQFGMQVHYNEFCPFPYTVVRYVWENGFPPEWWSWVSREEFVEALKKDDPRSCMIRYVWSFGNNGTAYLFGKDREEWKRLGHLVVVYGDASALRTFNASMGTSFVLPSGATVSERAACWHRQLHAVLKGGVKGREKQLERLERISLLQQVKQLEQLERVSGMTFSCGSYDQVVLSVPPEEAIVYCDPPYRGTACYVTGKEGRGMFSTEYFDNWVRNCPFPVYVSEYSAPFETVFRVPKRSLLASNGSGKLKMEHLYWNGVTAGLAAYAMPSANGGPHA